MSRHARRGSERARRTYTWRTNDMALAEEKTSNSRDTDIHVVKNRGRSRSRSRRTDGPSLLFFSTVSGHVPIT